MNYGLYQTLTHENISTTDLSDKRRKKLASRLKRMEPSQKEAAILLICEHARIHNGYEYDADNPTLPYTLKYDGDQVVFDVSDLPVELQHILTKFLRMLRTKE